MPLVKQKFVWTWRNLEKIIIILFFLTFSLNIRKVFLTPYSFLNGGFNEYATFNLGWADLLMIATIIIYTIKLLISQFCARNVNIKNLALKVSRETLWLFIFLFWCGISIIWSQYRPIAIYRFITFLEIILFFAVVISIMSSGNWKHAIWLALITNGLVQSLIGIAQFFLNKSLGLQFLGESIFGPNIDGVAKILISGEKHIRAYGTFPHPNILAGFLIIPIYLIGVAIVSRYDKVSHETFNYVLPRQILIISLLVIIIGFLLTLSRSAFLGLFASFVFLLLLHPVNYSQRFSSWLKDPRILIISFLVLILVCLGFLFWAQKYTSMFSEQSLVERQPYQKVSYETISQHPMAGVGLGQFILNEYNKQPDRESWMYQPVHNLYLLIFSELGIFGLATFLMMILYYFRKPLSVSPIENTNLTLFVSYCILFSFLVIAFFDHYFWDIKTGTIIFAIPFINYAISVRKKNWTNNINLL